MGGWWCTADGDEDEDGGEKKEKKEKKAKRSKDSDDDDDDDAESGGKKGSDNDEDEDFDRSAVVGILAEFANSKGGKPRTDEFFEEVRLQQIAKDFSHKIRLSIVLEAL